MNDFIKLMELRKTNDSNIILHLFSNPLQYREYVGIYTNLLNDLDVLKVIKRKPDKTIYDLDNDIKLILLLTKHIEKLHGYRYKKFRLLGGWNCE